MFLGDFIKKSGGNMLWSFVMWFSNVFFWGLTYLLLIAYHGKYKSIGMPIIAMLGNFVWELNIVIRYKSYEPMFAKGVTTWVFIDAALILSYLFCCVHDKKMQRIIIFITEGILYFIVMYLGFAITDFYMISSLIIEFIMALAFVFYVIGKKIIPNNLAVAAGVTRFLGDLAAWLMYPSHPVVMINGILVFCSNVIYLFFLIRQNIEYRNSQA
jgi:hypothetical protein